jgi:hypothetical protein
LIVQHLVNGIYAAKGLAGTPDVVARIEADRDIYTIRLNVDFNALGHLAGTHLNITSGTPLAGSIHANRLLWSAASLKCDLFLPSPIAMLAGDKLFEASVRVRLHDIIDSLQASVEFPEIRHLVNSGQLYFSEVLRIRGKAGRFRKWLQDEAGRDRDALIAYHHEVAKESGLIAARRRTLSLAGILVGGAVGGVGGALAADNLAMGAVAGILGTGVGYLLDLGSRVGADWRPVVFGNWEKDRIAKILQKADSNDTAP